MELKSKQCWIFDMDGTLTVPVHDFSYIRSELAIPPDEDILTHIHGLAEADAVARHARLWEIEKELAQLAVASAGALDLLSFLYEAGARLGILTRNDREIAQLTLETIGAAVFFLPEDIIGRAEAAPKPHPGGVLLLLGNWDAEPDQAVVVGDYLYDLQAGRSAGATTVHLARPDGQLWPDYADLTVATLAELLGMLRP